MRDKAIVKCFKLIAPASNQRNSTISLFASSLPSITLRCLRALSDQQEAERLLSYRVCFIRV
jgi:hypothetical protein